MKEQILKEYKYKLELHAHTSPASSCGDIPAEEWVRILANDCYNGIAYTNHLHNSRIKSMGGNEAYLDFIMSDYEKAKSVGDSLGVKVYLGSELRFENENDNDYLLFGIDEEIMKKAIESVKYDLATFVKEYKDERSFLIQAHPFREDLVRANPDLLDGIEVFNMHPRHNSAIALAMKWANETGKTITCGTDFHHYGHDNLCATRTKWLPENSFELAKMYRENDHIFTIGDCIIL